MNVVFVSNYINHHQIPLCRELMELSGGNFTFIQTEKLSDERKALGWEDLADKQTYVVKFYEEPKKCEALIIDSDCVIFGGTENGDLIIPRLEAGKFTLIYNERFYKTGRWKFISPRGLLKKYHDHTRFRKSPAYFLCAGAYVAGDLRLFLAYPHKKLKFGYFPEVFEYDDVHKMRSFDEPDTHVFSILWAGRFIDWKQPEVIVNLAKQLKNDGIGFKITMAGTGELFDETKEAVDRMGLGKEVSLATGLGPEDIRKLMLESDVFISTSDSREGWGAVINEAMNSGCVTIAPREIGAAPYLIDNGINGYMYKACDDNELFRLVKDICTDPVKRKSIGDMAYKTMLETWNAKLAAQRLWKFINDESHKMPDYESGPLSKA